MTQFWRAAALLLILVFAETAWGQSPPRRVPLRNGAPKVALNATDQHFSQYCTTWAEKPPCNGDESHLTVERDLLPPASHIYVLVMDGSPVSGVAGVSFGITYSGASSSGIDIFGWTLCANLEFISGAWPDSGTGDRITWRADNCQDVPALGDRDGQVTAVAGVFYVYAYSEDVLRVTMNTQISPPEFVVVGCRSEETDVPYPQNAGSVGFGGQRGYDPCLSVAP